jgi:DNA-binding SARP family transcriptional activator
MQSAQSSGRFVYVVGRFVVRPMIKLSTPARKLVGYLALCYGEASRVRAAESLWPDMPEEAGRANLRRSLWQVPRGWIDVVGDTLILNADCDMGAMRVAAATAISGGSLTFDQIDILSEDLLPGWHDEWATDKQDEIRSLRVQALEAACRSLCACGNHALAIQAGVAALLAEPLRESAAAALIEAHIAQNNRFDAIRCYRALAKRLDAELGVLPDNALSQRIESLQQTKLVA